MKYLMLNFAHLLILLVSSTTGVKVVHDRVKCMVQEEVEMPADTMIAPASNCSNSTSMKFVAGRTYLLASSTDNYVMDLQDSKTKQRNPIITYPRHGGNNQLWVAKASQAANSFNLITKLPGTIMGALTYDARDKITMLRFLSDGLSQQWYIGKQCGESVQIRSNVRNSNSGNNCLRRTSNGKPMEVVKCDEMESSQLWKLIMV